MKRERKKERNLTSMTWNDFEKNYKFKGFTEDQFKAYSNNYSKFTGKHVVVRVAWNNIIKTRYGFAMIIDRNHVVFGKNWQLWGNGQWNEDIVVSFNRQFFSIKEFGDFEEFAEEGDIKSFDDLVEMAKAQEKQDMFVGESNTFINKFFALA
ncbi:hypothetical protein [Lactobacillus jensenii]|nr:hypothetical protein [Lactobacillus jensenii]